MELVLAVLGAFGAVAAVAKVAITWRTRRAEARQMHRELRRQLYEDLGRLREPVLRHRARGAGLSPSEIDTFVRYASDCRGALAIVRSFYGQMTDEELAQCKELEDEAERILLG